MINPVIARDRDLAIGLLQPSKRDLDHGLELHRNSLVAESYGLGIHAPCIPEIINSAIEGGLSDSVVSDMFLEQAITGWRLTCKLRQEYREAWEASGVACTFHNAGEEGNDPVRMMKRLACYTFLTDSMPEFVVRAVNPREIEAAFKAGKRSLYLSTNGVPLAGNFAAVEDELSHIRVFAQLGVRMMHLTYNRRNPLGDGCAEAANGGLSDFGHTVVKEMNRLGLIIDLAHTGWQTSLDAARVSTQPVIVSHSTVHALNAHIRAKPDNVIRAILDTGGTMGITNIPAFLGGGGDINAFLDHIDYMVKTFGSDSVTIGTDTAYMAGNALEMAERIKPRGNRQLHWESLWPIDDPITKSEWHQPRQLQSLAWTNWPLFTVGLVQRGHSDETIRKVIGGNLMRVAHGAWETSVLKSDPES